MEIDLSLSKLCPLVLRYSFPLDRRVDIELGGPVSMLSRLDAAPRRGGGAGGAGPVAATVVSELLRGRLL